MTEFWPELKCKYCFEYRDKPDDVCGCKASQDMQARVQQVIDGIIRTANRPYHGELTSNQMRDREDRRHDMSRSLNVMGIEVKPEYQENSNE